MATTRKKSPLANKAVPVADKPVVDEPLPKPIEKPRRFIDRVKYFLQLWDVIWSVPLFFGLYYLTGVLIGYLTNYTSQFWDMGYTQPLFLACLVVVAAFGCATFVAWWTFRHVFRYWVGKIKIAEGIIKNYSKEDWNELKGWQRILFTLFIISLVVCSVVHVFTTLVSK